MTRLRYVGSYAHTLTAGALRVSVVEGTEFEVSDFAALAIIKRGTPVEIVDTVTDTPGPAPAAVNEIDLEDSPVEAVEEAGEDEAPAADADSDESPKKRRKRG